MELFRFFKFISLISFIAFMAACSGNKSKDKNDAREVDDIKMDIMGVADGKYPVIELSAVIKVLNESGAGYIFSITNDPNNVDSYLSFRQQAINLGIYGADLSYAAVYQKQQEVDSYIEAFQSLFAKLEIGGDKAVKFVEAIKQNQENTDSLVNIISRGFVDTYQTLMKNDQNELSLLILAGSWVEGIYLVSSTIDFAERKMPLKKLVLQHQKSLTDLLSIFSNYKDNEQLKDIYTLLNDLNTVFNEVNGKPDEEKVSILRKKINELRDSLV